MTEPPTRQTPPDRPPPWTTIVMVIGLLWVTLTGLCTASVVFGGDSYGFWQIALVVGPICMAPGLLMLFLAGRRR